MAATIDSRTVTPAGIEILSVSDWAQVTLSSKCPGVRISGQSGSQGMSLQESPISLLLAPNDRIFGSGPNGAVVNYSVQPMPWITKTILSTVKALGF